MSEAWEKGSDTRWRRFRVTILERDRWHCTVKLKGCTGRAEHVHHVVPLARGGAKYDPGNCTSACAHCNLTLGDRPPAPQPQPRKVSSW
jgi:5-methylcytosine-specific restriction endonuclease McrA